MTLYSLIVTCSTVTSRNVKNDVIIERKRFGNNTREKVDVIIVKLPFQTVSSGAK